MTTVVVSHDSSFLDKVCTHVINVKQRKSESGSYAEFFLSPVCTGSIRSEHSAMI